MFYHSRDLKHVKYGKIEAFVGEDDWLKPAYEWLGSYCKFNPQIWLSRSNSAITGKRFRENGILFGFDYIKGFNIDYEQWSRALNGLLNNPGIEDDLEKRIRSYFWKNNVEDNRDNVKEVDRLFPVRDYEDWKDNYLFE